MSDGSSPSDGASLATCPVRSGPGARDIGSVDFPRRLLGVTTFALSAGGVPDEDPRALTAKLDEPVIARERKEPQRETWMSRHDVQPGIIDGINCAHDGHVLWGWIRLGEPLLEDVEEATRRGYVSILRLMARLDYPYWIRAWNYLSDIRRQQRGRRRYDLFNSGRQRVFAAAADFERFLPASTTVGTASGAGFVLCFLASRNPGIQVENPRQVSSFAYPSIHGKPGPNFSRAVLQHWRDRSLLFVSSTASIVGHATMHTGNASGQLVETLHNVDSVVRAAARHESFANVDLPHFMPVSFRLYVRDVRTREDIEAAWRKTPGLPRSHTLVLKAEPCRPDVLVEVEALFEAHRAKQRQGRARRQD